VKILMRSSFKASCLAAAVFGIAAGIAADAGASWQEEPFAERRLPATVTLAVEISELSPSFVAGAGETSFNVQRPAFELGGLAEFELGESCSFVRPIEALDLFRGCGSTFGPDCPCDAMGTSHNGGGGCIACYR
jgi:hypothetical protein